MNRSVPDGVKRPVHIGRLRAQAFLMTGLGWLLIPIYGEANQRVFYWLMTGVN